MRKWIFGIFRAVGILVLGALCLEQVARVHYFGLTAFSYSRLKSWENRLADFTIPDPEPPYYHLMPNQKGEYRGGPLVTNSQGMPDDREYDEVKKPGVMRVAVLGASESMPVGSPVTKSWHRALEGILSRERRAPIEFMNFSIPGYRADAKLASLEKSVVRFHPDLVLYVWRTDEMDKSTDKFLSPVRRDVLRTSWLKRWAVERLRTGNLKPISNSPPEAGRENSRGKPSPYVASLPRFDSRPYSARLGQVLDTLKRSSERAKFKTIILASAPIVMAIPLDTRRGELVKTLASRGFLQIDFSDRLRSRLTVSERLGLQITEFDPHLNEEGHRIYAGLILEEIAGNSDLRHSFGLNP